jgi:hypothetical protein
MAAVRILASSLVAALLAALSLQCTATPFAVRVGLERVVLDMPAGFSDTVDLASPRLQDLAATLTSASNRVLVFGVTDADYRKFTNGEFLDFKRYVVAVTPKGLERSRVTPEQFSTLVNDSLQQFGKPADPAELVKFLDKQPIGRVNLLTELKKEPTLVSVLQGTRLPPLTGRVFEDNKPQYVVFSTTIFLAAGKALQLAVYSMLDSPGDAEWVRYTTLRWIEELQRLNSR